MYNCSEYDHRSLSVYAILKGTKKKLIIFTDLCMKIFYVKNEHYHVLQVILPSGETVAELQPQFDEIRKCPGRGITVSGAAPPEYEFHYYSPFFCPKFRVNEVKYVGIWSQHNVIEATSDSSLYCINNIYIYIYIPDFENEH
jgi:hypothetical protein